VGYRNVLQSGHLEEWIELAQDRVQRRTLLLAVLNAGVLLSEFDDWVTV
jgi:hypothetical protein